MPQLELSVAGAGGEAGLFRDPDFCTDADALPAGLPDDFKICAWKRPHELSPKPRMFVGGASRSDVVQGALGDCWFLSACAAVAQNQELVKQVIPLGQVLCGEGYSGALTFRFWRLGHWETVRIDDRLPVDDSGQLLYARAAHPDEFWVPLLEKAFAKFHGGYAHLQGGQRSEGLLSLSGLTVQDETVADWDPEGLFKVLERETRRHALITCAATGPFKKGLAGEHSYSVTGARRVRLGKGAGEEVRLVRVRNPFGRCPDAEWSGAWRDGDSRWDEIDQPTKDSMEFKVEEDGEFWMELNDFTSNFKHITFATKKPVEMDDAKYCEVLHGSWEKGISAGGNQSDMKMFATNPQFSLIVNEADEEDDECSVVLELIQENDRQKCRCLEDIALFIYEAAGPAAQRLSAEQLAGKPEWGEGHEHLGRSAVTYKESLPRGAYVLIASTFRPDRPRAFLLRAHSRRPVQLRAL
ncbi:hypothetical protein R5R35_008083 [Gryllus longicercus]|uniref:Calpain catalytic domain-containing protein n=1 Tax=Gryllus longicercus TaxID=2509291 RepID=A0AAN9V7C7_9ORTH